MGYEDTVLDRAKIDRYARRVAAELGGVGPGSRTVERVIQVPVTTSRWFGLLVDTTYEDRTVSHQEATPASRWSLDRRVVNHRTGHGRGDYNEEHNVESYHLEWDGALTVDWESWEDGISGGRFWTGGRDQGERSPMSDRTVLLFDHEHLDPTRRVRAHAKGVGLSMCLKRLLESHSRGH